MIRFGSVSSVHSNPKSKTEPNIFGFKNSKSKPNQIENLATVSIGFGRFVRFVGFLHTPKFCYIRERVWSKIKGWKEQLLSQASREVLIKSILQAIPTFTMGCFKLPKSLCKDIK